MEISAPATGLPRLSWTAPVTVPRLDLLALTLGACRQSAAENTVRNRHNVLALNFTLIRTKPPYVSRETSEVAESDFDLRKVERAS
jgi:hypothetical protein